MEKIKIAVIEDNYSLGKNIMEILQIFNFEVQLYRSSKEAKKSIYNYLPDLILADIHIFDGNCISELLKIRSHKTMKYIPLIILTGDSDFDELKFKELNITEKINKPIATEYLINIIRKHIINKNNFIKRLLNKDFSKSHI
jgi:DNA-binding response OmpR family regulator